MKLDKRIIALLVIGIIAYFYVSSPFSILPSFEGLNSGLYGVEINGKIYAINGTLPGNYWWGSQDVHNAQLYKKTSFLVGRGGVQVDVSMPQPSESLFETGKKVDYWVRTGENTYLHVVGQVKTYTMYISIKALNTGDWNQDLFQGERLWIGLQTVVWNRAFQLDDGTYVQAWEAPLAVYIASFELDDQGSSYASIAPAFSGRFITLYSAPGAYGTIDDLGFASSANLNATLYSSNPLAPDSRLQRSAYFPITLTKWGVGEEMLGAVKHAPVANYQLKIYTIQLGKYTYTTPSNAQPAWEKPRPESEDPFAGLKAWFSNPLNLAGLTVFFWGLVAIVTVIVLLWFFGRPRRR